MAERFAYSTGTITVANGASTITGTGTAWGGRDRGGSRIVARPTGAARIDVGTVADVEPRGIYDDLSLPMVSPYEGPALTNVAYEIIDGPAIANGASQASTFSQFNNQLSQNAGLTYNDADSIDISLVPNNSLIVDDDTKRLQQWRNGVLEDVANGVDGATVFMQAAAPDTDFPAGSIWIDSDSANLDVYKLTGSPLAWADTGIDLKGTSGTNGTNGIDGASALSIVRVVATANVAIATALQNGDSLDGVTLATNDPVLLTGQTAPAENGVYDVAASGAASRAAAFAAYNDHPGRYFSVMEGTAKHDTFWRCTSDKGGTLGTTDIAISEVTGDVAASTHAAAAKTTPANNDEIPLIDSAASWALKKLTWSNLKAALTSTFLSTGTIRERLQANRTYYVASSGNNSNDGLTALTPFLTKQKAVDTVSLLDIGNFDVTISVADGTYTGSTSVNGAWLGSGTVSIVGNTTTPANVIISTTSANCFNVRNYGRLTVSGMELRTTTSGSCLYATTGGVATIGSAIRFGTCATYHNWAEVNGSILAAANYSIVGGAGVHWAALTNGIIQVIIKTITITGTPAFATSFAFCARMALIECHGDTFSGSATGARYIAAENSVIFTNAGGATYLPGNAPAGTPTSNGGVYV